MLKSMYMYNVHFTKKYRKMVKQNFASMLPDIIFQDRSSRYNDVWYVKKIIAQNSFCRWIVWSNWTSKCDLKKCKKIIERRLLNHAEEISIPWPIFNSKVKKRHFSFINVTNMCPSSVSTATAKRMDSKK